MKLETLSQAHIDSINKLASSMMQKYGIPVDDRPEVRQDCFVHAMRGIQTKTFNDEAHLRNWLYSPVRTAIGRYWQYRRFRGRSLGELTSPARVQLVTVYAEEPGTISGDVIPDKKAICPSLSVQLRSTGRHIARNAYSFNPSVGKVIDLILSGDTLKEALRKVFNYAGRHNSKVPTLWEEFVASCQSDLTLSA